jgi:pyruvate kinase
MNILKKTKIVVSVGPNTSTLSILSELLQSGMNVVRLNFSHGDHKEHQEKFSMLKKASKKTGIPCAVLQDLGGPKIRTGDFEDGQVTLTKGQTFTFVTKKIPGTSQKCFISYTNLPNEVRRGQIIYLDDGKKSLQVVSTTKDEVRCKVLAGGTMKSRRGVNIPGIRLKNIEALTPKDKKDLEFGIKNDVDFFALSFVQDEKDILQLRNILKRKKSSAKIIAKIETTSAVENIDSIIQETDGIMVARGDLAVEIPPQDVPLIQKDIIAKCNRAGKPVIVATQMLASMVSSPRPSRAEVSDVANSILDGADAIMLSDETTIGDYPEEAVQMMTSIAQKTESHFLYGGHRNKIMRCEIADAVSHSAITLADETGATHIVALTESGNSARMISRFRPKQPIIAISPNKKTQSQILLSYGCYAFEAKASNNIEEVSTNIKQLLTSKKLAKKGDIFILVAGIPFGSSGGTNTIMAQKV